MRDKKNGHRWFSLPMVAGRPKILAYPPAEIASITK